MRGGGDWEERWRGGEVGVETSLRCLLGFVMVVLADGDSRVTNRVCSSIILWVPSEALLEEEVERRNKIVGVGFAVSVENRRILSSVVFVSLRVEGVRIINSCVGGRCCWAV